ncbi:MAG: stage II sporulation protein R [Roseburia sp.]
MKSAKKKRWMIHIGAVVLLIVLGMGICQARHEQNQQSIAQKVLRFHVRANSDSQEDQALKLDVRDAVGELLAQYLAEADSRQQSEDIVKEHMAEIVETATEVIEAEGYEYGVEVYVADVEFPVKTYGAYTFPAGTYRALEIVIGSGTGHNWWCVMYPNMCFADGTYDVVDEESEKKLSQTLTTQEYEELMETKDYQVSFRIVEEVENLFQSRK